MCFFSENIFLKDISYGTAMEKKNKLNSCLALEDNTAWF